MPDHVHYSVVFHTLRSAFGAQAQGVRHLCEASRYHHQLDEVISPGGFELFPGGHEALPQPLCHAASWRAAVGLQLRPCHS